jgi:hypothetical protein
MSSIARHGNRGQSNYVSAKAALAANTVTWAREFAAFGIRVGAVAPGMIETPMTQGMNQKARDALVANIPVGRIGLPEDIWLAVKFVLECDYFNGRCIDVDGGLTQDVELAILGLTYLGFLLRLPRETAKQFTLAGALYLTGALLLELPLGYWTERHGDDGLGYALIDWCEETLEFVGLTLFARHLLDLLGGRALRLRGPSPPPSHITAPHRPDEPVVPEVHQRDDQRR